MNNMRLDKFLADLHVGTRREIKDIIRMGRVSVDGRTVTKPDWHIHPDKASVQLDGKPLVYTRFRYYMLNKPSGMVSATKDGLTTVVIDLFQGINTDKLFPVGRLDKDTEGLLLITDDGMLAHLLLSPARGVEKTYEVHIERPLDAAGMSDLSQGVDIGDETRTLPAVVHTVGEDEGGHPIIHLTIREGRFHQVKRMLHAVGNDVRFLKRISIGTLKLDDTLLPGEFRELTGEEVSALRVLTGQIPQPGPSEGDESDAAE